jgi:hypothetical protein
VALALIAPVPAQDAAPEGAPGASLDLGSLRPAIDPEAVWFDEPGDGALWARGSAYKAAFDPAGVTYIPFFGSRAPRSWPIRLTLESLEAGGAPLAAAGTATPLRSGNAVVYRRGAVLERYDLTGRTCEQTFVIAEAPRAGDLVVRMRLATDLEIAEAPDGVELTAAGWGRVHLSRAVAIDARGARADVPTTCADGLLELRVPAAALADCVFPLTIDPVIITYAVDTSAEDDTAPDVAYDAGRNWFLVCWERGFSATDHDIWAQVHSQGGGLLPGSGAYIDEGSVHWTTPKVAYNRAGDQYLVVATNGLPTLGVRNIGGRSRNGGLPVSMLTAFEINTGATGDCINPDVGGDPRTTGPTYYTVVWQHVVSAGRQEILARQVQINNWLRGTSYTPIDIGPVINQAPRISPSCGHQAFFQSTPHHVIVWQRQITATNHDIHATLISPDGALMTSAFPVESSPANDRLPVVSSITDDQVNRRYIVAWLRTFTGPTGSYTQIMGKVLNFAQDVTPVTNLSVLNGSVPNRINAHPSVDTDGTRFAMAYTEDGGVATTTDVYAATFHLVGNTLQLSEGHRVVRASPFIDQNPELIAWRSGGGTGAHYEIVWDQAIAAMPSMGHDIHAAQYEGHTGMGGYVTRATGCGGLSFSTTDQPTLGTLIRFVPFGTVTNPLWVFGLPLWPTIPLCPPALCALGIQLEGALIVAGPAPFSITVPRDPALLGAVAALQLADVGSGGGCTGAVAFRTSPTLLMLIE